MAKEGYRYDISETEMSEHASILIVDDQPLTLATIQAALELDGYQVYKARDGIEALEVLQTTNIDLIIADIAMPRMNGYQLFEVIRRDARWIHIPFIFLTARSLDSDIRYGKELGADDYLTKPFQVEDLRASISGKLRRVKQQFHTLPTIEQNVTDHSEELVLGELRIQPDQHRLIIGMDEVRLSVKEFSLLLYLARHRGQVIPLEELCKVTHNLTTDKAEAGSLLYPLVRSLRKKIAARHIDADVIHTVRGVGYYLK
jgi:DNA-binding response OmpR family regulator